MEVILKTLRDRGMKVSFFVEGANAAHEQSVIRKIKEDGHLLGNYSFVGTSRAERLGAERLIEQFAKTQKVLELTAGSQADYFALPDTRYLPALLHAAKTCGLDYAVASSLTVTESDLAKPGGVQALLQQIQPGMIVTIRLDHPVPVRFYEKTDEAAPAVDKEPTITDVPPQQAESVPLAQAVGQLCDGLAGRGYTTAPVSGLAAVPHT